jgi:hypothetical protein
MAAESSSTLYFSAFCSKSKRPETFLLAMAWADDTTRSTRLVGLPTIEDSVLSRTLPHHHPLYCGAVTRPGAHHTHALFTNARRAEMAVAPTTTTTAVTNLVVLLHLFLELPLEEVLLGDGRELLPAFEERLALLLDNLLDGRVLLVPSGIGWLGGCGGLRGKKNADNISKM